MKKEGREGGSPGLEENPELQLGAQVHYRRFEDAQGWTSEEGAALGGDKGGDTGKLAQHRGCTLIDPKQPKWSPHIPIKATVPTQKRPQASSELLVNQHPPPAMLPLALLMAVAALALLQPGPLPENAPEAATRGDFVRENMRQVGITPPL